MIINRQLHYRDWEDGRKPCFIAGRVVRDRSTGGVGVADAANMDSN